MKPVLLAIILGASLPGVSTAIDRADQCAGVLRAESFRQMSRDELGEHRERLVQRTPGSVVKAICESTAALTNTSYRSLLERARQENLKAGGPAFDPAELYFFLECGEDQVNMSPLAYHAFNLNRDEYGFLGESTLAIVWMSVGYLDIKDPGRNRSFMDAIERLLAYARKTESQNEIELFEDLLLQIEGFEEDHMFLVSECRAWMDSQNPPSLRQDSSQDLG